MPLLRPGTQEASGEPMSLDCKSRQEEVARYGADSMHSGVQSAACTALMVKILLERYLRRDNGRKKRLQAHTVLSAVGP